LEHLLFKGTARRTALDIATAFDQVGGEANAITSKEYTCYFARVLDTDVPMAADVLTDMITSATLSEDEMASERRVILEELAMHDDDPSEVVHERFAELVLGGHPLGRPIAGTPETIRDIPRDAVRQHYQTHYRPDGLVITAAGGVNHDQLCELVGTALADAGWECGPDAIPLPMRLQGVDADGAAPVGAGSGTIRTVSRQTEQAHLLLGGLGIVAADSRRFAMSVLGAVLGGGMSSRLFQEIRERRGLAYSVYSFASAYTDSGYAGMYAGCAPGAVPHVVELLEEQLQQLACDLISHEELSRAIGQLSGGMVLGMEDSGSRMARLGRAELVYGELLSIDEALARVAAVTRDDVRVLARELAGRPRSLAVVGPFTEDPVNSLPASVGSAGSAAVR
jgi:predicted Zn-dependent peptidase